jgi:hypothetical protein
MIMCAGNSGAELPRAGVFLYFWRAWLFGGLELPLAGQFLCGEGWDEPAATLRHKYTANLLQRRNHY